MAGDLRLGYKASAEQFGPEDLLDLSVRAEANHEFDDGPNEKKIDLNIKIAKLIDADKVFYNDTTNLAKAIGIPERELCFTCSTGDYTSLGMKPKFKSREEVKGED